MKRVSEHRVPGRMRAKKKQKTPHKKKKEGVVREVRKGKTHSQKRQGARKLGTILNDLRAGLPEILNLLKKIRTQRGVF